MNLLNDLEIYSTNLGINERGMRIHLSLSSCTYIIYNECNYALLGGDHSAVPVCDNDRRRCLDNGKICNKFTL